MTSTNTPSAPIEPLVEGSTAVPLAEMNSTASPANATENGAPSTAFDKSTSPMASLDNAAENGAPSAASDKADTVVIEDDARFDGEKLEGKGAGDVDALEPPKASQWTQGTYGERFRRSMKRVPGLSMASATPDDYPDGYYGWVVLVACFFVFLWGLGLMYSWGVYQKVYFYQDVFPGTSLFQLSWVGSLGMAVQTVIGPLTGRLSDKIGQQIMCFIGGAFVCAGYICASFSTAYWHLLVTQGFMYGVGAGFLYFAMVTLPSQFFFRHRGMAIGIAVAGAGIGGLVIGPMTQTLIDLYGWQWSLRITGLIAGGVIGICGLFIRTRFELVKQSPKLFDTSFFKDYKFVMLYCSFFIQQWGFFVPFNYMPSFAVNAGMTSQQGALALGLSNASSAIGRIVIGAFADRLGHINGYSICMILTPLFTLLIWPFATSFGVLCLFGILFGFFSGGFISLFPTVVVALFGPVNLGSRMGSIFTSTLAGNLAGSPVAGAILGTTQTVGPDGQPLFNYLTVILYSGLTQLAAGLIIFALRFRVANWVLKKRL